MASLPHRLAKARDITAPYSFIHVVAPEASLPSNFTYETVKYIKKTMPLARMTWIMGADNLVQLQQWRRYKSFIYLLPIAVIDRPSYSYQAISAGRHLFKHRCTSAQLRHRLRESRVDLPSWCFIAGERHQASATAIRQSRAACHALTDDK
jgi:nicotinate-nucleotide adenylyltransferase